MSDRAEFSAATRKIIWERAGGQCEGLRDEDDKPTVPGKGWHLQILFRCNAPLDHGCFHYDHIDPSWIGHSNDPANGQLLCIPCHKVKTAQDIKDISKIKRILKKAEGKKEARRPLPFGRKSKLRKKINGKVVPRHSD